MKKDLYSKVNNKNNFKHNPMIMFIVKPVSDFSDTDNVLLENIINKALREIDKKYHEPVVIPNQYSTNYKLYSEGTLPFFYDDENDVYGFTLLLPENVSPTVIKDVLREVKAKYKLTKTVYISYGYFNTFWAGTEQCSFKMCKDIVARENINKYRFFYCV